jgi:subtilisin family serine protease
MAGTARSVKRTHRSCTLRLERLENRALLSSDSLSGALDPATTVLVRFNTNASGAATQSALRSIRGSIAQSFPDGPDVIELHSNVTASVALGKLDRNRAVDYGEPDSTIQATEVTPNDPNYPLQWGLNNPNGINIDAPQAWSVTTGNPSTIVAVLDTGLDTHSPEFSGHLWVNPTAGSDGYIGDVNGWNFVNNTANIQDNNGHGTHVTGILAAAGNNSYGIAGVDWNAEIMPLKILGANGSGTTQAAVSAIYFAVNHGARVINASWGGSQYSQAMLNAISYANSKGVVFVTAAGNTGADNDTAPANYPANYRLPNELVVAAVDSSGNLASFSDYGRYSVNVAAPGVNIFSTVPGGYASYSGTSMSTAFVSGTVALVAGLHPELTAPELVQWIDDTVKPLPSLQGTTISGGMVDAYNAVSSTPSPQGQSISAASAPTLVSVESTILATDATYQAFGGTPTSYVTGLYNAILGRAPDPTGLAYYAGLIGTGDSRSDVIAQLQGSDEARRTEIARWYQAELNWDEPIADLKVNSGVEYWAGRIDGGESDDVIHAMILADGLAPSGGASDYVTGLYEAALGRAPDPDGLAYLSGQVQQGVSRYDVALGLLTSNESRRAEIARFYQYGLGWADTVVDLKVNSGVEYWAGLLGGA